MRYEIIVEYNNEIQYLDTNGNEPISLNYNISNINDISSRNSSYSKTITLPETAHNRQVFSDISDLSVDSLFNPNKRTKAYILVDSYIIFDGYLQLKSAKLDISKKLVEYEVVIMGDNDNLFAELGDKELTDIDFSELNHYWSSQNIINSWTSNWQNGYYYPLIDYGYNWRLQDVNGVSNEVKIEQMFPSTNVKYIIDKIFNNIGKVYNSTFLNSDVFKDLYIPFNKQNISRNLNTSKDRLTIGIDSEYIYNSLTQSFILNQGENQSTSYVELKKIILPFNDENSPNGDPDNLFNIITHKYEANDNFISERFCCDFDLKFNTPQNIIGYYPSTNICFKRSRNPNTGLTVSAGYPIPCQGFSYLGFNPNFISNLQYSELNRRVTGKISTDLLDNSTTELKKLYPGENVWVEVNYNLSKYVLIHGMQASPLFHYVGLTQGNAKLYTMNSGIDLIEVKSNTKFFNVLSEKVIRDEEIDYNKILPEKIKQKDFLTSIIKMFNLYIEPDKNNPNSYIIEPRDQYYESGIIKDWTKKIDISKEINEQILGDTQNKKTIFTYKDDKDYYNEDYKSLSGGRIYGDYNYIIDNDFITGEKKIELIFSPTPLAKVIGSYELILPVICKVNNNISTKTDHNIRILTRYNQGVLNLASSDTWKFEGSTYQTYPYLGHFNNPQSPNFDLNFGQTIGLYYEEKNVTSDNLFSIYWANQINELSDKDSRIITAEFYLDSNDISSFRFNDNIFINGQYYKVNKIDGYDPTREGLCKVELIKTKYITIPKIFSNVRPPWTKPGVIGLATNDSINTNVTGNISTSSTNSINKDINGIIVAGKNNYVSSSKSLVIGDNNEVNGTKNLVIGDNNKISTDVVSSFLIGDNTNINTSNTFVINNILVINSNYINAGSNEILGLFPANKTINWINGGRNCIRQLGSMDVVNNINSRTEIL